MTPLITDPKSHALTIADMIAKAAEGYEIGNVRAHREQWAIVIAALRAYSTSSAIEQYGLHVFPPERWKGAHGKLWTVRKEDANQNVVAQARAECLDDAVRQCIAAIGPRVGVGQEGME